MQVLQVIEGLAFGRQRRMVSIRVELLVYNENDAETSLVVVHRGRVTAELAPRVLLSASALHQCSAHADPASCEDVLLHIYGSRLLTEPEFGFRERRNCFGVADALTTVDHVGQDPVRLIPLLSDTVKSEVAGVFAPFSAYEIHGILRGRSWVSLLLELQGPSYDHLVGGQEHFWVDGPDRVLEQIVRDDLRERGYLQPGAEELFRSRIAPFRIEPKAYDIAIFRPGTAGADTPIACTPVTGDVYQASVHDPFAQSRADFFITRSLRFLIDLCYESNA